VEIKENSIKTELEITSDHHQPMGLVHGGVYSSMAEAAISTLLIFLKKEYGWV